MDKVLVLHHSKVDLPDELDAIQSLAAYTHMMNLKAEIPYAVFVSFIHLKKWKIEMSVPKLAPWVLFNWLSVIFRFPYCFYLCIKYDKIIIYHSEGFYYYTLIFKIFRKKTILQVNEIYSNVSQNKFRLFIEKRHINTFKKLIVSNFYLKFNWFCNKEVFVRGGYFRKTSVSIEQCRNEFSYIYAGSIDEFKMGNYSILLKLINSIPQDLQLYLCLVTTDDIFQKIIHDVNKKANIYLFRDIPDKDLQKFYLKCKYGLVLQDSTKPLNLTSFPSKIFSYLNNGLIPIAQRHGQFLNSEINDFFGYIDNWDWIEIRATRPLTERIDEVSIRLKNSLNEFINS